MALLAEGARAAGFPEHRMRPILEEDEAAHVCLGAAEPGDLVVLTSTDIEAMWQQVMSYRPARPVARFAVEVKRADESSAGWRMTA